MRSRSEQAGPKTAAGRSQQLRAPQKEHEVGAEKIFVRRSHFEECGGDGHYFLFSQAERTSIHFVSSVE